MEQTKLTKPIGIIDALSGGFNLVARRPWLVILPIALDIFFWLTPPITAQPIFDQLLSVFNASVAAMTNISPDMQTSIDMSREVLVKAGTNFNALAMLAWAGLGMPSLEGAILLPASPTLAPGWIISDAPILLGWMALFALVGMFIGSIYLETLGRAVRPPDAPTVPHWAKAFLNVLLLVLLLGALGFFILLPLAIGASFMAMVNQGLASFLIALISVVLMWSALYLTFVLPAIFVTESNPVQALINSVFVFRNSFWSALGLVAMTYLIQMGFSIIWDQLRANDWGLVVNVVANSFLGTGLVASIMIFYYNRLQWLAQLVQQAHAQRPTPKG